MSMIGSADWVVAGVVVVAASVANARPPAAALRSAWRREMTGSCNMKVSSPVDCRKRYEVVTANHCNRCALGRRLPLRGGADRQTGRPPARAADGTRRRAEDLVYPPRLQG